MAKLDQALQPALPEDHAQATLAGRVWRPDQHGPSVVVLRGSDLHDISAAFPTCATSVKRPTPPPPSPAQPAKISDRSTPSSPTRRPTPRPRKPWLLAPIDLQASRRPASPSPMSMLERVIEERARGDPAAAAPSAPRCAASSATISPS